MKDQGWNRVVLALREFLERGREFMTRPEADEVLREQLRSASPNGALFLLKTHGATFRAQYLTEILEAIVRGPQQSLVLARDVMRSLPRGVLEERVPDLIAASLEAADDYAYARAGEILVELRLNELLDVLRAMGTSDADIRWVVDSLENVEQDPRRWGRLVQAWPIVSDEGGPTVDG